MNNQCIYLFTIAILFACHKNNLDPDLPILYPPFVIENLGVQFGDWDSISGEAGDFIFTHDFQKIFVEFGASVKASDGGFKQLPHFSYIVKVNTEIVAIAEGEVFSVYFQEDANDYDIGVRSIRNPNFEVYYDHMQNVKVEVGDQISPGQILGNPRSWGNLLGFVEIMINNTADKRSYCPFVFFEPENALLFQKKVNRLILDWETFKKDTTIHVESSFVLTGCIQESMLSY